MSQIESRNQDTIEVDYKDHVIEIPSQHNWIAVVNQTSPVDGLMKSFLASFSKKPILSRKGNFMNQPGDDYTLLVEVNPVDDVAATLQQVQGKPEPKPASKYAVLNAAAFKLAEDILVKQNGDDSETKVFHDIYCPEHGLLGHFFNAHQRTLQEIFGDEDDEEEEEELPEEFKQLLGMLGLLEAFKKSS